MSLLVIVSGGVEFIESKRDRAEFTVPAEGSPEPSVT